MKVPQRVMFRRAMNFLLGYVYIVSCYILDFSCALSLSSDIQSFLNLLKTDIT